MSGIVAKALAHLKELEETMKNETIKFSDDDIANIDEIADCLQELENEVKVLHEQLETQTIVGSVLRHKLAFYPKEIKQEIDDAVKAARASNDEVVQKLNVKLEKFASEIEIFNKKDDELSKLISILQPKKEEVEDKNQNIINMLNQRMSQKAECQIKLNETRNTLRETLQFNKDTEEDIIVQKENLMKFKTIAREQKSNLEEEKYNNNEKAKLQEEKNSNKQKEVDNLEKEYKDTEEKLRGLYRENERIEESIINLENKISEGENEFEKEKADMNIVLNESLRLTALDASTQQNFVKTKADIIEKTRTAIEQSAIEAEKLKELKDKQTLMEESLKEVFTNYKRIQEDVAAIYKITDSVKSDMGNKIKEMTDIDFKNKSIYEEMARMEETYNSVMEAAQHEIEELREQIAFEREEKAKKQQQRDLKLSEIEAFQAEVYKEHTKYNSTLSKGKQKYNELTAQNEKLDKNVKDNEVKIESLSKELSSLLNERQQIKEKLELKKDSMQKYAETLENDSKKLEKEITDIEPGYNELVDKFNNITKDYDEIKRTVILTKGKKTQLEEQIEATKKSILESEKSREFYSTAVHQKRAETLEQLKQNNDELKKLENEILSTGLLKDRINEENIKFEKEIEDMEKELDEYNEKMIENDETKELLSKEYEELHEELMNGWKNDDLMRSEFKENDLKLVKNLNDLLERTLARESKLYNVTDKIYKELEDLNQYIGRMAGPVVQHSYTPPRTYDSIAFSERATTAGTQSVGKYTQLGKSGVFTDSYSILAKVGTPNK